jgi:hypothetical protein
VTVQGRTWGQVLRRHGLTSRSARALQSAAGEIRSRTIAQGIEFAALIEARDGEQLGPIIGGVGRTVDARSLLEAMLPGHDYVQVHSHPESSAFSWQDAGILIRHQGLRATMVVGADGTVYLLSQIPESASPTLMAIRAAYFTAYGELLNHYRSLVQSGHSSAQSAWREHSHEIWQHVSGPLNLRYDRLQSS